MKLKSAASSFVARLNIANNNFRANFASTTTPSTESFYTTLRRNRNLILESPSGPETVFGPHDLNTLFDYYGHTPLQVAINLRDHEVAQQLIKYGGAELSQTALHGGLDRKWVEYFRTRPDSEQLDAYKTVIEAVRRGNASFDQVQAFIDELEVEEGNSIGIEDLAREGSSPRDRGSWREGKKPVKPTYDSKYYYRNNSTNLSWMGLYLLAHSFCYPELDIYAVPSYRYFYSIVEKLKEKGKSSTPKNGFVIAQNPYLDWLVPTESVQPATMQRFENVYGRGWSTYVLSVPKEIERTGMIREFEPDIMSEREWLPNQQEYEENSIVRAFYATQYAMQDERQKLTTTDSNVRMSAIDIEREVEARIKATHNYSTAETLRDISYTRSGARLLGIANIPVAKPLSSELQLELATICGNLKQIKQLLSATEVTAKMIKLAVENLRPEALKQLLPLYKGNLYPARNLADKMAEAPASDYARIKALEMAGMICPTRLDYTSKLQGQRKDIGLSR